MEKTAALLLRGPVGVVFLLIRRFWHDLDAAVEDDTLRSRFQFTWLLCILAAVSLGMTFVNILTRKQALGWSTFLFALLCVCDVLLIFFIVSGTPEGFSALWICMLPTFGILLYGRKKGSVVCAVMLAVVLFFFDTPWGVRLLQYPYTASFKLRFPMLYLAFYAVSMFLETIRVLTQQKLIEAREQYRYLYVHDALTGLLNRYGFNERMDAAFAAPQPDGVALLIVDIDHFKNVNDSYGHLGGDKALREVAARLCTCVGTQGDVCRWGGEEFAILLPRWQGAAELGSAICTAVHARPVNVGSCEVSVTVSVGVFAVQHPDHLRIDRFVHRTDACLYRAKAAGRDRAETDVCPGTEM